MNELRVALQASPYCVENPKPLMFPAAAQPLLQKVRRWLARWSGGCSCVSAPKSIIVFGSHLFPMQRCCNTRWRYQASSCGSMRDIIKVHPNPFLHNPKPLYAQPQPSSSAEDLFPYPFSPQSVVSASTQSRPYAIPTPNTHTVSRYELFGATQVHFIKHVHNAIEAGAIYASAEGDLRVGNLRYAAPVIVNRYNPPHDDPKAKSELESSDGRVVSHIASYRTPSGSSSLRFGGPYTCMWVHLIPGIITINPSDLERLGPPNESSGSSALTLGTTLHLST
jgi:hypothetical protein